MKWTNNPKKDGTYVYSRGLQPAIVHVGHWCNGQKFFTFPCDKDRFSIECIGGRFLGPLKCNT